MQIMYRSSACNQLPAVGMACECARLGWQKVGNFARQLRVSYTIKSWSHKKKNHSSECLFDLLLYHTIARESHAVVTAACGESAVNGQA